MTQQYVAPEKMARAFSCPHCGAYAHQRWWSDVYATDGQNNHIGMPAMRWSQCAKCEEFGIWISGDLIHPEMSPSPLPTEDMPNDVKVDYLEARNIVTRSPRGAVALLRLAVQKLMPHLGEKGKKIDDDIASLVQKGLRTEIQKALDTMRVIGNNAVHPGQMDLKDKPEWAIALFKLLNMIVEQMITQKKELESLYSALPDSALEAISKRDGKSP